MVSIISTLLDAQVYKKDPSLFICTIVFIYYIKLDTLDVVNEILNILKRKDNGWYVLYFTGSPGYYLGSPSICTMVARYCTKSDTLDSVNNLLNS